MTVRKTYLIPIILAILITLPGLYLRLSGTADGWLAAVSPIAIWWSASRC